MQIKKAEFISSSTDYKKCPAPDKPEYAFVGRSNVGKSSLINRLTNHTNLAKTSQKPGKTQLINHFLINNRWYLVDLPGYGWAKVSKTEKAKWEKMIQNYLQFRENLLCVFVLIDSRLEAQENDLNFMRWLGVSAIPFVIVFTKADKQSRNQTQVLIAKYKKVLSEDWEEFPTYFITSALDGRGNEEMLQFIAQTNAETDLSNKI